MLYVRKYDILCISNLRITSKFPSQGQYFDVLEYDDVC